MDASYLRTATYVSAVAVLAYVLLPSIWGQPAPRKYTTGLVNTGNDCYANSTFQALAALDSLVSWLADNHANPWNSALLEQLKELKQEEFPTKHTRSIWPLLHVMEAQLHARLNRGQQDAHEMLIQAIDLLIADHQNFEDGKPNSNPFLGEITDTITCLVCKTAKKNRYKSAVVERQPNESILQPQVDYISDYFCSTCQVPVNIEKRSAISLFPQILAVHINRSFYNGQSFRDTTEASIPLALGTYKLRSVVFHTGYHNTGHYTCARRKIQSSEGKNWWLISDDTIREASDRQITAKKGDVYLLLFEKSTVSSIQAHFETVKNETVNALPE